MFLSENREINAYSKNYLVDANSSGTANGNTGEKQAKVATLNTIIKGLCQVKTQFINEVNSTNNKLVILGTLLFSNNLTVTKTKKSVALMKKYRYLIIREWSTANKRQRKVFIEFYKDDTLDKLKFIIDTDYIEQVGILFKAQRRIEKEHNCYLKIRIVI